MFEQNRRESVVPGISRSPVRAVPQILGLTPFHTPDASLAEALARSGARAAVDLGHDLEAGLAAASEVSRRGVASFGVRLHADALPDPARLPDAVEFMILPAGVDPAPWAPRRVLVQVTSVAEALAAASVGADEVIAVGAEAAGRVGEESTFILLQRVLAAVDVPVLAQGGIGPATAAACLAGGASGVVLDTQLALLAESSAPEPVRRAVERMDGSETRLVGGHRVFDRPDLRAVAEAEGLAPADLAGRLGGYDLERRLLPVGQDAAFASVFAARYGTVDGAVRGFRRDALDAVRRARETRPLAPGAPFAEDHGTRYPILQGPMTRVSDTPEFATSVAEAGALPFLALSMLRGEDLRTLLESTRESLGERPWGVGILGFVEPEVRAEQLAAIEATRPPFALIAGGRPAQARTLESRGIPTYLHVPSTGLLELFLKDGARRFVFEGRECGGHVGPLYSFALWQSQVECLLAFEDLDEVSVAFAGGIHDARSAAMVSALAAPLAARGAKVGVLIGTAYLFTPEAVASGAILASYQEAAIGCAETALLETGPGHATRCIDTEYARAFREERRRLEAEGKPGREMWESLERMNLGRLRVATKGVERRGEDLVEVDVETARSEGMYMIGQVAALRGEVVPMEALHRDVSEGAVERIEALETAVRSASGRRPEPTRVAIVGMDCVFPGAEDLDTYWSNIVRGIDSIREVPPERWNPDLYFDPDGVPGRTTPSKWGGFLHDVAFDPMRYGIPPRSMGAIDPIQLLSLEVARRALEDAGYPGRSFDRDRTAVVFGAEGGTDLSKAYGFRALWPQYAGELPEALDRALPVPSEDSFPGVLTNVISGRIANRLDLGGENYTVNAACASSLAALSIAVQWLGSRSCDMVLVGGADVHNSIGDFLMFSSVHALSPSGRCATFDSSADGIALGEGVGVVVLKRLEDARADGDEIYAVIEGVGGSSDGRSMGLTAPRPEGQVRALRRAYEDRALSPADVGLMEAHGTGTVVGDRTELGTMESVFREAGASAGGTALGSVKSQIGHTKGAAGIASLIKVAMALRARTLPPTLHVQRPNPSWDPDTSPFTFATSARPWVGERRVAALSAFGFGGTNYHAVLSQAPNGSVPEAGHAEWPAELFAVRGVDDGVARERGGGAAAALGAEPAPTLREVARAVSCGGNGPVRFAFAARTVEEARARLGAIRAGRSIEGVHARDEALARGRVAFLFPGQGSQYVGMLASLFVAFPRLAEILGEEPGIADRIHPPSAFSPRRNAEMEAALTRTDVAQVALGMCDVAVLRMLRRLGAEPDMMGGHSYGEMVALHAAGAWDLRELLDLSAARARAILDAAGDDPGGMAAVAAEPEAIEPLLDDLDGIWPANLNAADQTILSGRSDAIEAAVERLNEAGVKATKINVACAFHSPVVAAAREAFGSALDAVDVRPLQAEVWSNARAEPYPADPAATREILCDQLESPVLWRRQIEAMHEAGARVFVEVGPGRVLSGLVDRVLGDRSHAAIALDARGEPGLPTLVDGLARLATAGMEMDLAPLWAGRCDPAGDVTEIAAREIPATTWWVNGQRARPVQGEVPEGGYVPVSEPVVDGVGATRPDRSDDGEAAVLEYLRNVRALVEAQRDVVLGYLDAERPAGKALDSAAARSEPVPRAPSGGDIPRADRADEGVAARPARTGAPEIPSEADAEAPELDVTETLLSIVATRTGYPTEMLDLDLDLEADLSIDSIKRLEILGTLDDRLGLGSAVGEARDEMLEELATIRTLRGIVEWVESRTDGDGASLDRHGGGAALDPAGNGVIAEPAGNGAPAGSAGNGFATGPGLYRSVLEVRSAPPASINGTSLVGRSFAITDDGRGVAPAIARLLVERGATARVIDDDDEIDSVDGVIHLAPLRDGAGPEQVKALFRLARTAVRGGATWLLATTGLGGSFGHGANGDSRLGTGGISGLLKSLALEWPDGHVRAIDLDPSEDPELLAGRVVDELIAEGGPVEVAYARGDRRVLEVVSDRVDRADAAPGLPLDGDSVVLVTGGGRGVTARVAIALARATSCNLEIVGRTPEPTEEEPAATADVDDPVRLRGRLAELEPGATPAGLETRARRILAEREVRSTLAAIRDTGSRAVYHSLDVRDSTALAGLIDDLYALHGRIDGVIHGAGTIEDKRMVDKTLDSFERVFDTKVEAALTLAEKLRDDVRFVVFFSSVAGVFGNPGQTDYAAANEVLDHLAEHLAGRDGARALSVAWGPWDEVGMVGPELRRAFERQGVGLIPVDEGVDFLLREIARPEGPSRIVVTRTPPTGRG